MTRYILIDNNSGYIWGDTADLDGPARDETPVQAARRLDESLDARASEERTYTFHRRRRAEGDGYLIYQADIGFEDGSEIVPLVGDGQDQETIDQIDRECRYLGFVSVEAASWR